MMHVVWISLGTIAVLTAFIAGMLLGWTGGKAHGLALALTELGAVPRYDGTTQPAQVQP